MLELFDVWGLVWGRRVAYIARHSSQVTGEQVRNECDMLVFVVVVEATLIKHQNA